MAGQPMWAAIEDAGRLRDALGVALPVGIPEAFTEVLPDPLGDLVARWARTHGPFTAAVLAERYGLGVAVVGMALRRLAADGRVAEGEFLAGARGTQWCDSGVLRMLRRRCLARLRKEAEPVPPAVLGRFLPAWHGIGSGRSRRADAGAVLEAIERLAGAPVPASALETLVLPGRVPGYSPALLDELTAAGEVVWAGAGSVGSGDGWLVLAPAESAPLLLPEPAELTHDAAARRAADRARRGRRHVLPHAQRPGRGGARRPPGRRRRPRGGALGPGLGGPGHQRHPRAAARGDFWRHARQAARRATAGRRVQPRGRPRRHRHRPRVRFRRPRWPRRDRARRSAGRRVDARRLQSPARRARRQRVRRRLRRVGPLRARDAAVGHADADRAADRVRPVVAAARAVRAARGGRRARRRTACPAARPAEPILARPPCGRTRSR